MRTINANTAQVTYWYPHLYCSSALRYAVHCSLALKHDIQSGGVRVPVNQDRDDCEAAYVRIILTNSTNAVTMQTGRMGIATAGLVRDELDVVQ